jgi:hypothetical protein
MSPENPETEIPQPIAAAPADGPTRRRTSVLGGALLGAIALTTSLVGVSAIASAQDDPEVDEGEAAEVAEMSDEDLDGVEIIDVDDADLDGEIELDDPAWAAFDECITNALGDDTFGEAAEDTELTDEQWEALEAQFEQAEQACEDLLPEDVKNEIAAWKPYEECIDGQLGELDIDEDTELSDADFEALEAQWAAADEACFDLLPESAKADAEAFEAYDQCLTDAGFNDDMGAVVYVEDGETGQSIQFGESTGTVTITGDASGVSIATDGDVSVIDDDAFEACDELLPDDLFELDEDLFDEGDLDEDEEDGNDG